MSSHSRMLISQNRQEIFVTIASYSAIYTEYLMGTKGQHADSLTLYEYGPVEYSVTQQHGAFRKFDCAVLHRKKGKPSLLGKPTPMISHQENRKSYYGSYSYSSMSGSSPCVAASWTRSLRRRFSPRPPNGPTTVARSCCALSLVMLDPVPKRK